MIFSDILTYLRVIARRWWVIAILFVTTMSMVLVSNITSKAVYRAQVKLQVLAAERQEVYLFSQFKSSGLTDEVRAAQADFIAQLRSPFVARLTRNDLSLGISDMDLLGGLAVSTDGDFITLVVEADQPELAEAIATRQAANALDQFRKVRSKPSTVLLTFISDQLKVEEDAMLKAEEALIAFKREHSVQDLDRELQNTQDGIRTLRQQADQASAQQQQYLARAGKEREQAALLRGEAEKLASALYTATFYKDQANKIEAQALDHEIEAAAQAAAVEQYKRLVGEREAAMTEILDLSAKYNALQRGLAQASGNYEFLVGKSNEARLKVSQAEKLGFIQVVEPASKPSAPAPSRVGRIALVGAIVSILAGIILAFALEFLGSLRKRAAQGWSPR